MAGAMIIPGVSQRPQYWLGGTVTFAAGTSGAVAQHTVFTITGMVAFAFFARCTDALTSGGAATISHGNVTTVDGLGSATVATTIDAGDAITPSTPTWMEATAFVDNAGYINPAWASTGTDITADILTTTITGGTLEYYLIWTPLSVGASVTLGAELTAL